MERVLRVLLAAFLVFSAVPVLYGTLFMYAMAVTAWDAPDKTILPFWIYGSAVGMPWVIYGGLWWAFVRWARTTAPA